MGFGGVNIQELQRRGDVDGLLKALTHKDYLVRRDAANALGAIGDPRAVVPLMASLSDKRDATPLNNGWVHQAAAKALGEIGDSRAVDALIAALGDKGGLAITEGVAKLLVQRGDPQLAPVLAPMLAVPDPWILIDITTQKSAASALGRIGDARAVQPLAALLEDRSPDLALVAADALTNCGEEGIRLAVSYLEAAVHDGNGRVRSRAASILESVSGSASATASHREGDQPR
jgi:HEAT repeat protein